MEDKKRVVTGSSSTDLIFSAYVRNNEDLFPMILSLYVPIGSHVADVTYGKGVFWKKVKKVKLIYFWKKLEKVVDNPAAVVYYTHCRR